MTRQQEWAKHAHARVVRHRDQSDEKRYSTLCMKAPSLIRQAGLIQAVAFLRTRDAEGLAFVDDLATGLGLTGGQTLQDNAHRADLPQYMALSRNVSALAVWFRRFAQAELQQDEG